MKLYYKKTDGGAQYLMDQFIVAPNGDKVGVFEGSKYVVRIDGDIEKDAELNVRPDMFDHYIDIFVQGGVVTDVKNLPDHCGYNLIDLDDQSHESYPAKE